MDTKLIHASESGHWYTQEGEPAYTIIGANGEGRDTTLRDARKLNLFPSVTTVQSIWASPGLDAWKRNQLLLAAATAPYKRSEMDAKRWAELVLEEAEKQAKEAAERGTHIHAVVEQYFTHVLEGGDGNINPLELRIETNWKGYVPSLAEVRILGGVVSELEELDITITAAEKSFSHKDGFGGKRDLDGIDGDGELCFLDIKTKEFLLDGKGKPIKPDGTRVKLAWPNNCEQLAAYCYGAKVALCDARLINLYVSVLEPGLVIAHEWTLDEAEKGLRKFLRGLVQWQDDKNYKPTWR